MSDEKYITMDTSHPTITYNEYWKTMREKDIEIDRLKNTINKAKVKSIELQEKYGYILDDLIFLLMQGDVKEQ